MLRYVGSLKKSMSTERVLLILRNIKLLLNQLRLEIDNELKFEHLLINSIESSLHSIEILFGQD